MKFLHQWCMLICFWSAQKVLSHSIVFVHVGGQLPSYLSVAVEQARLFNETCDIYLIADQKTFDTPFLKHQEVTPIAIQ